MAAAQEFYSEPNQSPSHEGSDVCFAPILDAGNQGAEIEAMREGVLIAVQCQRYNRPIGIKSVQEACAGKTHDRAGKVVVIGTSGFTPAAIEGESPIQTKF